jgi:hypothetical protein
LLTALKEQKEWTASLVTKVALITTDLIVVIVNLEKKVALITGSLRVLKHALLETRLVDQ